MHLNVMQIFTSHIHTATTPATTFKMPNNSQIFWNLLQYFTFFCAVHCGYRTHSSIC